MVSMGFHNLPVRLDAFWGKITWRHGSGIAPGPGPAGNPQPRLEEAEGPDILVVMRRNSPAIACVLLAAAVPVRAGDWPQWRGPNRDGVAVLPELPSVWPEKLPLLWKVPAGPGYSTPVIAGGRCIFTERSGGDEAVRAIDAETGKDVWRTPYPAPYEAHPYAARHGTCPKATSTVAEGRVFSYGISGILTAMDAATGKLLWKRDLGTEHKSAPLFGASASPLVEGGLVVLPVGNQAGGGGIMAFRAGSGETAWRSVEDGPSYASAIAADLAGLRQVLCFTGKRFVGVALADGRELWSHPIEVPFDETIVTAVVWKDRVVFSGRNQAGTRCIRPRRDGDAVKAEEVWKAAAPVYMTSPVVFRDHYYAVEHVTGKFFCLRLEDGAVLWKDGNFGDYASLVLAGDRILALDSKGSLTVIDPSPEGLKRMKTYKVSDADTYAHLVVAGSRIYVRDAGQVQCFDLGRL
jgi:outer membrane protein assembly factor BamB